LTWVLALGCAAGAQAATPPGIGDLPLVEHFTPAGADPTAAPKAFVLLFSGDGGFSSLTRQLTATLNAAGYPVVGWNTLKYFWHAKTPAQAGEDLGRVIRFYRARLNAEHVILVGYSMGADVLPALANRLPGIELRSVASVVLLAPARAVAFEFHLTGWLNRISKDAVPIKPEVLRLLPRAAVVCVYGADEADASLCTELGDTSAACFELPGAHHFDGNYAELAELVIHGRPIG